MNVDTLVNNFEILAEAPDGINQIRELILNLAVGGKLVSREKTDGVLKSGIEGPFQLPGSWRWELLTSITTDLGQEVPKSEFQYIDVGSINNKAGRVSEEISLLKPDDAPSRARKLVKKGTVLYSTVRPYLRNIAIVEKDFDPKAIASTAFAVLHPSDQILSSYLFVCVRSSYFTQFVESKQKGVAYPAINAGDLKLALIPLPPIGEQQEIIVKVDELMALCDQLEQQQKQRDNLRTATRKSAIDAISTAITPEELEAAWKRINNNWKVIADTPESIDSLRELILDLAVRGDLGITDISDAKAPILWDVEEQKLDVDKLWKLDTMHVNPANGWSRLPLARLGTWGSGGTPTASRKEFYNNGSIPWAVIGDLNNGIMTETSSKITQKALASSSAKLIPKNAVLIAMYGASIGKTAVTGIDCTTNQAIAHCIMDESVVSTEYFFLVAKSLKRHLVKVGKGAAQPNISQTVLKHLLIDVPQLNAQHIVVSKVNEFMALCDQLETELKSRSEVAEKFARSVVNAA